MLKFVALTSPVAAAAATSSRRLLGRHRERLLADDVPAGGEDRQRLRDVEVVGRRDVDDVDAGVGEEVVERRIARATPSAVGAAAPRSGRAAEHAADLDADPAQRLDVDGADEAGPDDGGADRRRCFVMPWHPLDSASAVDRSRLSRRLALGVASIRGRAT